MLVLSIFTLLPFIWPITTAIKESLPHYATHFCERCGIRLAYFHGDINIVCVNNEYLVTSTQPFIALSPIGLPPSYNIKLYALPQSEFPPEVLLKRSLKLTRLENGFISQVKDRNDPSFLLRIPLPVLVTQEWFEGQVFLPFAASPAVCKYSEATDTGNASTADIHVNRQQTDDRQELAAILTFSQLNCSIRLAYTCSHKGINTAEIPAPVNLPVDNNPAFRWQLFFPFMSKLGPLAWTTRLVGRKEERIVLRDAYDRIVAYCDDEDNLLLYGEDHLSERFVEEVVTTFIGITIQRVRTQDYIKSMTNYYV
jgi:hypothetical protein